MASLLNELTLTRLQFSTELQTPRWGAIFTKAWVRHQKYRVVVFFKRKFEHGGDLKHSMPI